jgi:ribose transport system permease protein
VSSTTTVTTTTAVRRPRRPRGAALRDYGILVSIVVLVIALSLGTSTFLTVSNMRNLLDQLVVVGVLAVGETLCIVCGMFDLSVSAIMALAAIAGVAAGNVTHNVWLGFVTALVVGPVLGALNGAVITGVGVNSFIATLATSIVFRGLAVIVTGGAILYPLVSQDTIFAIFTDNTVPFSITLASVVFIIVAVVLALVLARTTYGRMLYAVGGNPEAARLSGINTTAVRISVLAISGLCAAFGGLVLASRSGSASSSMGTGLELTAISAAVVGGTSILGGEGAVWRAVAGALILQLFTNGFNLLGWNTTYQTVLSGALILVAVSVDQRLRRRRR